jgi:branched-chain amino acid transport system permease protein
LLGPLVATALILTQEKFFSLGAYVDKIILGSVLVLILGFFPQGLMGLAKPLKGLFRGLRNAAPKPPTASIGDIK